MTKAGTYTAQKRTRGRPSLESANKASPETQAFIEEFCKLGFTEYEAKAYLTLCRASPATAYEVSKLASLPRANVYSALETLTQCGAVQPITEDPVKYIPVKPTKLLEQIARSTTARCKDLARMLELVQCVDTTDYVWMLNGDDNIHRKIDELISGAKQHIWAKAPRHALEPHIEALKKAARRGVHILLILFGPQEALAQFSFGPNSHVYLHEGSGMMIGSAHKLVTISVDFEEALTVNIGDTGHGAFTRNSPVVYMAESLLRHEIYLAEIFQKFGPQIEEEFGPSLIKIREKYLPANEIRNLRENVGLQSGKTKK